MAFKAKLAVEMIMFNYINNHIFLCVALFYISAVAANADTYPVEECGKSYNECTACFHGGSKAVGEKIYPTARLVNNSNMQIGIYAHESEEKMTYKILQDGVFVEIPSDILGYSSESKYDDIRNGRWYWVSPGEEMEIYESNYGKSIEISEVYSGVDRRKPAFMTKTYLPIRYWSKESGESSIDLRVDCVFYYIK